MNEVIYNGKYTYKDDSKIKEVIGVHKQIKNPYSNSIINISADKFASYVKEGIFDIAEYPIKGEALFDYVTSLDDEHQIYLDDDGFIYTYSERLQNYNDINQLDVIINRLNKNINSNRAIAVTYNPMVDMNRQDIPCLQLIQALVRDDKLILSVYFRSNDLYGAFPSNMMFLTYLGMKIADELGVQFDYIDYHCSSLHIYETDYEQALKVII
ncbi:MAG: thymidylate synthase [Methanobrevibacter sp.]|nr:thymidylate synthase [Methanobrevibacter sp.]